MVSVELPKYQSRTTSIKANYMYQSGLNLFNKITKGVKVSGYMSYVSGFQSPKH